MSVSADSYEVSVAKKQEKEIQELWAHFGLEAKGAWPFEDADWEADVLLVWFFNTAFPQCFSFDFLSHISYVISLLR